MSKYTCWTTTSFVSSDNDDTSFEFTSPAGAVAYAEKLRAEGNEVEMLELKKRLESIDGVNDAKGVSQEWVQVPWQV